MGIAIAAGASPAAGLLSGVIGGILVGSLGGSPFQVSGPANSLIVLVGVVLRDYGMGVLGAVVLTAGVLQMLAGVLRLGQWFRAVSPAVIHGMMTGFAVIIFASQFHVMLDAPVAGDPVTNLVTIPDVIVDGLVLDGNPHHQAAMIGAMTVALLLLWKRFRPHRLRAIPASLVAVLTATIVVEITGVPIVRIVMPENLTALVTLIEPQALWRLQEGPILEIALTIAFLASTESLLSAAAVDQLHSGPRTKYDRELTVQGLGNMVCGVLGALPLTGVIIRSAANVSAGARSRLASVLHGVWLLGFTLLLPGLLEKIPTASLAAVLLVAVFGLINVRELKNYWREDWMNLLTYLGTAAAIIFLGVLAGVALGILLSLAKLVYKFSHLDIRIEEDPKQRRTIMYLSGTATFIRLPKLAAAVECVPSGHELHVRLERLNYIDDACLDLLMNWARQHEATGGRLIIDWDCLSACFKQFGASHGADNGHPQAQGHKSPLPALAGRVRSGRSLLQGRDHA
jgi:MFS superfamily sulfate permease-like transporter